MQIFTLYIKLPDLVMAYAKIDYADISFKDFTIMVNGL